MQTTIVPIINEGVTDSPNAGNRTINFKFNADSTVYIISRKGYFTDKTLTENLGRSMTCKANTDYKLYLANEETILTFQRKNLTLFGIDINQNIDEGQNNRTISFDISELKDSTSLTSLEFGGRGLVSGDISNLSGLTSLTHISFWGGNNISGDVSTLSGLTSLTYFSCAGTSISGDIQPIIDNLTGLVLLGLPLTFSLTDEQTKTLTDRGCTVSQW